MFLLTLIIIFTGFLNFCEIKMYVSSCSLQSFINEIFQPDPMKLFLDSTNLFSTIKTGSGKSLCIEAKAVA